MSEHRIVSTPLTSDSSRSSLRQGVLVVCAVGALFTAVSTSLKSQRSVAGVAASSSPSTATHVSSSPPDSCSVR